MIGKSTQLVYENGADETNIVNIECFRVTAL